MVCAGAETEAVCSASRFHPFFTRGFARGYFVVLIVGGDSLSRSPERGSVHGSEPFVEVFGREIGTVLPRNRRELAVEIELGEPFAIA